MRCCVTMQLQVVSVSLSLTRTPDPLPSPRSPSALYVSLEGKGGLGKRALGRGWLINETEALWGGQVSWRAPGALSLSLPLSLTLSLSPSHTDLLAGSWSSRARAVSLLRTRTHTRKSLGGLLELSLSPSLFL